MLHVLKRHWLPISAHFDRVLVLTYAFPKDVLRPLLPPGLELDTFEDYGFLAVATVQTRSLRPSFLPEAFGRKFFLTGYRIFSKFKTSNGQVLRGLKILRSDTDSSWMVTWGNRLTHYGYCLADVACTVADGQLALNVKTTNSEADLEVVADIGSLPGPLPDGSPFPDVTAARKFAGPLPHTFDYEKESHSIIVVRGVRQDWIPQPVKVTVKKNSFLNSSPFRGAKPVLANAFFLKDVPYNWERGWREPLPNK
jgi:hypothetical protein